MNDDSQSYLLGFLWSYKAHNCPFQTLESTTSGVLSYFWGIAQGVQQAYGNGWSCSYISQMMSALRTLMTAWCVIGMEHLWNKYYYHPTGSWPKWSKLSYIISNSIKLEINLTDSENYIVSVKWFFFKWKIQEFNEARMSETKDQEVAHDAIHFESQFCHICHNISHQQFHATHGTEPLLVEACLQVAGGDTRTFDKHKFQTTNVL